MATRKRATPQLRTTSSNAPDRDAREAAARAVGRPKRKRTTRPPAKKAVKKQAVAKQAEIRSTTDNVRRLETRARKTPDAPKRALQWLYNFASKKIQSRNIPEEAFNPRRFNSIFIGGMFLYEYDPKHKDTLPWYDRLPVIVPIGVYNDGWLGLNLHYLEPTMRFALLNKLMEMHRRAHTPRAYMRVSYQFLQQAVKTRWFEPCVKRYLASHVRSTIIRVSDEYWHEVAMLPIQKFVKARSREVWSSYGRKYQKKAAPKKRGKKGRRR